MFEKFRGVGSWQALVQKFFDGHPHFGAGRFCGAKQRDRSNRLTETWSCVDRHFLHTNKFVGCGLLHFQAKLNRFFNSFHQRIKRFCLRMATA